MVLSEMKRWLQVLSTLLNPKGTGWYVISYGLSFAMNVLFTVIAASSLGAGEFGGFTLFGTLTQFGVTITNSGFYTSTLTKANSHSSSIRVAALAKTRLTTSLMLFKLLLLTTAAPICLLQPSLSFYVGIGLVYILLNSLQPLWLCQLQGKHGLFNLLQLVQRACFVLAALIGLKLSLSLPWICLIFSLSPLPATLWFLQINQPLRSVLLPRQWLRRRTWKATVATLHSESKFLLVDLLATLAASLPTLIIAKTSSLNQLGAYSLAERFKNYVITVFSPLNSSQYHRLCRYYLLGLYGQASILLSRYQLVVWLLALSLASLGATVISSHLSAFGGGQYDDAHQAFMIFTLFIPFLTISAGFNLLYFSTQRLTTPQQLSSATKIILFALIYWPIHGPVGSITAAAAAAVASELLATLLAFLSSQHRSRLNLRLW